MAPKGRFSQEFEAIFQEILQDLKETLIGYGQKETFDSLARGLEYNLQNAEQNIALLTMLTYEQMVKAKKITSPDYRLASILGWCGEILNAGILICDDVLDRGQMRRSLPCWYTLENVGLNAVTDAFLLHQFVFLTLTKHCRHLHCYTSLMELFHEVCFRTACGKSMDVACTRKSVNEFNLRDYKTMAVNKATFYNFYLPFALSMHLAGFTDLKALSQSLDILAEIGLYFQIQNDYLDCFGNMQTAGKIGTDIEDSKYSWLAITCMERANEQQKLIMMEGYGSKDPLKVQRVKDLYKALDLPSVFAAYEEKSYNDITDHIKQISSDVPPEIFLHILNKIYRR